MVQLSPDAFNAYRSARRSGKKYIAEQNNLHRSGFLPVLEPQLEEICSEFPLGYDEVPLDKIRGTYATGRATAFAGNFMPLLSENSEFADKWKRLYESALEKGITEPITVYEYLGYYYVVEGNKRVSVSRCLSAYSLRAKITRLLPPFHKGNLVHEVYQEYIAPNRKILIDHMWFSEPGRLSKLRSLAAQAFPENSEPHETSEAFLRQLFYDFRSAYHKQGLHKSLTEITTGDAFWQYCGIYGLPIGISSDALQKHIKTCEPQLKLMAHNIRAQTISDPSEMETRSSLLSFFKTGRITLLFAYCGTPGTRFSATIHDVGRYALTRDFPPLDIAVVQDLPSNGTAYDSLRDAMEKIRPNLMFATDSTLGNAALRISLEFRNSFTLFSHDETPGLLGTYYTDTAQPAFLLGVLAGSLSRTSKIGYLRPSAALGGREHDLQAFAQGIKTVRPAAEIFYSIPKKRNKADRILPRWAALGIDMAWIPQFYGYPSPFHKTFPGVYASLCSLTPDGNIQDVMAYGAWHWDSFYTRLAAEILEGSPDTLSSQSGRLHFRLNLSGGVINVHPAGPVLGHWSARLLSEFRKALISGLNPLGEDHLAEVIEIPTEES